MFKLTIDYDKVSKIYDQVRAGDPELVHQIMNGISLTDHSLALDIGCGTGNNTLLFATASGVRVIGLDISYGMLEKARVKTAQIPFVQAPADKLPFNNDSLDLVFMTDVIHHLPNILGSLKEIHRVLIKQGSLCIVTQSHRQIDHRMTSRFFPATAKVDQERYPDIDKIKEILSQTGFHNLNPVEYNFSPALLGEDYLNTIIKRGFSMLHKISNEDYERGLKELKAAFERGEQLNYSAGYTFVWAVK